MDKEIRGNERTFLSSSANFLMMIDPLHLLKACTKVCAVLCIMQGSLALDIDPTAYVSAVL